MATALLFRSLRRTRDPHSSSLSSVYRSILASGNQTQAGVNMLQGSLQMVREAHAHAYKVPKKKLTHRRSNVGTTIDSTGKRLGEHKRQFTFSKGKSAGRNSAGRITIFHRGGGAKRLQRQIDMKRSTSSMGIVEKIDYDPNRSSRIALVRWVDGVQLCHRRKCNKIEEFTPPQKILEPTTTAIRSLFSFSSLPDQRKAACFSPGLTTNNLVIGTGSKKTCANDVFLSALSSPKAKGETASHSFSRSSGFPRIAIAGAKPAFFVTRIREKVGGEDAFSLCEVKQWKPHSDLLAHRIKRKAAVSWQSFTQQETLGFVQAAEPIESKLRTEQGK